MTALIHIDLNHNTSHCLFLLAPPSAPKELKFSDVTKDSVHLTWEPPDDDGGSPLTGYVIEKRDMSRKTWTKVSDAAILEERMKGIPEGGWEAMQMGHGLSLPLCRDKHQNLWTVPWVI